MPAKASGWCKVQPVTGGPALRWLLWLGPNKVGRGYVDTGPAEGFGFGPAHGDVLWRQGDGT